MYDLVNASLKQLEKNEETAAKLQLKKNKVEPINKQSTFSPYHKRQISEVPSYTVDNVGEINIAELDSMKLDTGRQSELERSRTYSRRSKSNHSVSISPDVK
jgi:hypothetical protein